MQIHVENLRLRSYVGIYDWEQKHKQDVVINIYIDCDSSALRACETDNINDALDYKSITKKIIGFVEDGRFALLEKMIKGIADIVLTEEKAQKVRVRAEKPTALRFSDSVSVELCLTKT